MSRAVRECVVQLSLVANDLISDALRANRGRGGGPGSWPQFEDNSMMQIHDMINNASCKAAIDFRD